MVNDSRSASTYGGGRVPALTTVLRVLAKTSVVTLSVLVIVVFSAWGLLDLGSSKDLTSVSAAVSDVGTSGYWLVASDGGVFAYGDAGFYGSSGDPPQRAHRRHGRHP